MKLSSLLIPIAAAYAVSASAQSYPERPVRVVVPFPAGGAADIVARQVTQGLAAGLGTQFVVDNRGGAGGAIGAETVTRAAPDGYTLLFASSSALSINPHIAAKISYDALRDFTPIALIGFAPNVLVVHPSVPAKNVKELIAVAKSKPGALNFGSNGTGTLSHLTGELFMQRAGVKMVHIPYKGAAPAVIDTMAGNVSVLFAAFPSVSGQERVGKLRALAVTSARRAAVAPNLPTVAEAALPGFESSQWWGLFGPAGLPATIVARLNAETNKVLKSPDLKKRLAADGAEPAAPNTPQQLAAHHRADFEKWAKVVKAAGIKPEF
ncbi:MAG TPA: tripartite tricarboxylate transporter substrate binding protein [Burkholderiales bacterium]|nr:tripartite tricarboxylate transporter substrate binding protein [Burkholderiales bacterium]